MKKEVISAVDFLVDLLRVSNEIILNEAQLRKFREHVCERLWTHYKDHWFPDKPLKGSGYRCIRINGKMDPLIAQAGATMGMSAGSLRSLFPSELTMWIDPNEVSYRIGENGSICVLYGGSGNESSEVKANSTPQQTPTKTPASVALQRGLTSSSPVSVLHHKPRFSPSKPVASTPPPFSSRQPQTPSPPHSPLTPPPQHHNQMTLQQHQQLLFLINNHSANNCKDSFRSVTNGLDSVRGMERLFVSS